MAHVGETEESAAHVSKSIPQGTNICCHGTEGGRNLVVNLDGTGNQFGDKNTNVVEMYSLLHKGEDSNQLSLYYSGIGTYARPSWTSFSYYKQVICHKIDLAIAWEFEKTIMGAYSWLSDNYRDGDRIFLLGFSRGAFQVRALSAMIDKVGLLYKGNNTQIPFAHELYADPLSALEQVNAVGTSDRDAEKMSKADRFKSAFCHKNVKVHFVGAWDTVSSIGLVRKKKLLPGTIDGMKHVCFFRHALALDERRVKFLPEYAYGGTTLPPQHSDPAHPTEENDFVLYRPFLDTFLYATVVLFSFPWRLSLLSIVYRLVALYMTFRCLRFAQDVVILEKESTPYLTNLQPKENPTPSCPGAFHLAEGSSVNVDEEDHGSVNSGEGHDQINWNTAESIDDENPFKLFPVGDQDTEANSKASTTSEDNSSEANSNASTTSEDDSTDEVYDLTPQSSEVWFAGTHSDIGGGNVQNTGMDRSRPPLRWMVHEAQALGLRMRPFTWELSSEEHIEVKESLTGLWTVLEWLPFRRLTFGNGKTEGGRETYRPHHGVGRIIQPGQKIHGSLRSTKLGQSESDGYIPKACLSRMLLSKISRLEKAVKTDEDFWKNLGDESFRNWLEVDLEEHVEGLLCMSISEQETQKEKVLNALKQIPTCTLYDSFIRLLQSMGDIKLEDTIKNAKSARKRLGNEEGYRLLKIVDTLLPADKLRDVELVRFRDLRGGPVMLLQDEARKHDTALFLVHFTKTVDCVLETPSCDTPVSITFSADGKWLASGHIGGTIWIWDLKDSSQPTGKALGQHSTTVTSVAFSPDSKRLVSGSENSTICLWDIEKMEQVGDPWNWHTKWVNCVAFSPNGTKVVSGSRDDSISDETLCVWNSETGKEIAVLKGHELSILSVAFSPDGQHIVSGSADGTARIWDACTYQQDGEPLRLVGHTDRVVSVAYSPDGKRIVSGSGDHTISIWDADTRVQVGKPLQGHSSYIYSVCFSPNGKLLASGSDDHIIRIWNVDTGAQIGEGLCGHHGWVWRVAFSPDGKQLASASAAPYNHNSTIRMWDMENYVGLSLLIG
ncbi:hypothetical protein CPC08DRAFT_209697 [Agrocybe pediades]|nr:hypothetical protein CPC08DRAFT_209697 [Agrocybe pediades]